jgi:hypothetical protein
MSFDIGPGAVARRLRTRGVCVHVSVMSGCWPGGRAMSPNDDVLVRAVNRALADPNFRASVQQLHAEQCPLVDMVETLGLDDDMSDEIRQILAGLSSDVVAGIRAATLAMLDTTAYEMPLACSVTNAELVAGIAVDVSVGVVDGTQVIQVQPANPG